MPTTAVKGQVDIKQGKADPFDQHPEKQNVDFVADKPYQITFEKVEIFGVASAPLKTGHNPFHVKVSTGHTKYWVKPEGTGPQLVDEQSTVTEPAVSAASTTTGTAAAPNLNTAAAVLTPTGNVLVP
jgi:hypothetical protein